MAELKQMMLEMKMGQDSIVTNVVGQMEKKMDNMVATMKTELKEEIQAQVQPMQQQMAKFEARLLAMEQERLAAKQEDDDGDASMSSGPALQSAKKAKTNYAEHVGMGSSGAASSRTTSQPPRFQPPPSAPTFHLSGEDKHKYALFVSGFERTIPRSVREKVYDSIVATFHEGPRLDAKFSGKSHDKKFFIDFTSKEYLQQALDDLRRWSSPLFWEDKFYKKRREIYIKRNKTLEQQIAGRFHRHFYDGVKALVTDTKEGMANRKLRVVDRKLLLDFQHDGEEETMELLWFEETLDSDKQRVTAAYEMFSQLKLSKEVVDAMITTALAAAKAE